MNPGVSPLSLEQDVFREEVLVGLQQARKTLPPKYFYDARGSRLFDRICELDAYYPTRTETALMNQWVDEMVACLGRRCLLVEYGSGSSVKTRILLDHLPDPAGYVPIDISGEHLLQTAEVLAAAYPALDVYPVVADYSEAVDLPEVLGAAHTVVFFPGSTIGNFEPQAAVAFLKRVARLCGACGGLLIGVDLQKDIAVLEAAYNDPEGVTEAFNKNILLHINRVVGADFNPDAFAHHAFYNPVHGRIEMHLISLADQWVTVADTAVYFHAQETICTEYSYKYTLQGFASLAAEAGLQVEKVWVDDRRFFSVQYLNIG